MNAIRKSNIFYADISQYKFYLPKWKLIMQFADNRNNIILNHGSNSIGKRVLIKAGSRLYTSTNKKICFFYKLLSNNFFSNYID
jgi:hypothetical protein